MVNELGKKGRRNFDMKRLFEPVIPEMRGEKELLFLLNLE